MTLAAAALVAVTHTWVWWEGQMPLTSAMRADYEKKFISCVTSPDKKSEVAETIARIDRNRERYETVAKATGAPSWAIAVIHEMECDGNFKCHLHNGDSLRRRTVNEPKGRPLAGAPPFTWEASAIDAVRYDGLDIWKEWGSVAGTLYKLELYNGMGYRSHGLPSPYLWAGSQFYVSGLYVSDGHLDLAAKSKQVGAAVLLRALVDHGLVILDQPALHPADAKCAGVK